MPAAALAAAPIASDVLSAGVQLSKSVVAQLAAAMGTPLLSLEHTQVRPTKKGGTDTTVVKAGLPAWVPVAAAGVYLGYLWVTRPPVPKDGSSFFDWRQGSDNTGQWAKENWWRFLFPWGPYVP